MDGIPLALLADLPASTIYVNPFKLAGVVVAFVGWAWLAAWVDKDTIAVNSYRVLWNFVSLSCGAVATGLALFVPVFAIGYPAMLVLILAFLIVYVVHRNGLVREEDRVLTPGHFKRLKEQGFSGKKKLKEVKEKVRLYTHEKKPVAIPEEPEPREQYRLAQDVFFDALWRRASVVELLPTKEASRLVYQVDGRPVERDALPRDQAEALVSFVKSIAGLNIEERRKPQRGYITAQIADQKQRVLVRTDGSTAGEKLSLRIFGREIDLRVADLGFTPKQLEQVTSLREISPGLILLSAPPGHGLTTTIYSFVRTHDRFLQNVQMIEFDKEIDVDNVTQKLYSPAEGKTFAELLLRVVRSDPDIIVLPELRDRESAAVAAQAATQKQKVYVGVVANDAFDALRKWLTLVGDKSLVARSLLAVGNQRLVRVLCTSCKQAYKPDAAMMRKLNLPADKVLYRPPEPQFDKSGNPVICQACQGSGYMGRTGVFDWLMVDDGLREVIKRAQSLGDLQTYLQKKGALALQAQALQKVLDGLTSIQEVARATRSGDEKPPAATAPAGAKPAAARGRPAPGPAKPGGN